MKFKLKYVIFPIISIIIGLFIIRLILPSQLDDVTPGIYCEKELLKRADVYYVIPMFEGIPISDNRSWCEEIKSYGKKLEMHGIRHTYEEFRGNITREKLEEGMRIFENCFGYMPDGFKPPQEAISDENKKLVREKMRLDIGFDQVIHKVYHCSDTGVMPNWLARIL